MSTTMVPPGQPLFQTQLIDNRQYVARNWFPFFTSLQQLVNAGPYLPVFLPTGANSNGGSDDTPTILSAYNQAVAAGGGIVYLPPGDYNIATPIVLTGSVPVTFLGSGRSTRILRAANMPSGKGVFDLVSAKDVTFNNFLVDGAVTTSVGVTYTQVAATGGNPRDALFSDNSSFWLHDGCQRISFNEIVITHTGGYAVFADAFNDDITDLYFYRLQLENNRPQLFGLVPTDCNYGAWTGGVFFSGNGVTSTAMVRRAEFQSCSARRVNGTAFWLGHLSGFSSFHEDIRVENTFCEDIGRDPIQPGGVVGMRINNFSIRRSGYVTYDDTSQSTPKWLSGEWAVGVDCGVCYGMVINNVQVVSGNGGALDLDGCYGATVSNFYARVPRPEDPEYITDQIGSVGWAGASTSGGPNAAYGALLAQASYNVLSEGEHCLSNINVSNCSNGAIKIFGSRNNHLSSINIQHPAANTGAPISIGNLGPTQFNHSFGNTLSGIRIAYDPTTPQPCVKEDGSISPFVATDVNQVLGIEVVSPGGLATPFEKDPASGSIGSLTETIDFSTYAGVLTITGGYITGS